MWLTTLCKMGWDLCMGGGLPLRIQLLYFNKARVQDFIRNLADGRACSLEMTKG